MYNFGLSADQEALRSSLRRYMDAECKTDALREIVESHDGFASAIWRGLGDLGVFGLAIPEAFGGSSLGYFDLAVVMETLGRAALPAPVIETFVTADLIARAGSDDQKSRFLPKIASGDLVASFAADANLGYASPGAAELRAAKTDGGWELTGSTLLVPYAHVAGLILCAVRMPGCNGADAPSILAIERERLITPPVVLDSIDDGYRLCQLILDGVRVTPADIIGKLHKGRDDWQRASRLAAVLGSAEQLGCMEKGLEMVVAYGHVRSQFGKLIGSYQAMKHRCADLLIDLEAVRGSVYYAAYALQCDAPDAAISVHSAKAYASDAAVRSAEKALQSMGAIGFCWEYDIHFYLKRSKRLELAFGDASHHRELIAQLL